MIKNYLNNTSPAIKYLMTYVSNLCRLPFIIIAIVRKDFHESLLSGKIYVSMDEI